jgi:NADPH:quinone reductase-like Zn-dependent oxidoreductase
MRAVGVTDFGGPEALKIIDVPAEALGRGDVRLRVRAATVNPTDTQLRAGAYEAYYPDAAAPWIPGMELAGEVVELGDGVDHLEIGDLAMGIVVPYGAYRDEKVLPGNSVVRAPADTDAVAAATLPMNGLTARRALDLMALKRGQVLAVTGAAGAFGGYVVELAKNEGLTVVADASEPDESLVRGFGADIVVRRGEGVAQRIRDHFPNGVDGLADGALQGPEVLPAVADGGAVATVRNYEGDGQRGLRVHPVLVSKMAENREALDRLRQLVEDGKLTLRVAQTFSAEDAAEAHRRLEQGGTRGRIVLTF